MKKAASSFLLTDSFTFESRLLVAVSAGRDSVALAHALHSKGYTMALAHVNYRLRGTDSDTDETFVRNLSKQLKVPFFVHRVDEGTFDDANIQLKAREIRYRFFEETRSAHGYTHIALAHHQQDRIESLFLNLLRGTGIYGLNGMPYSDGFVVRPLIKTSSERIDEFVKAKKIEYRVDASNAKPIYSRNRIRLELMPMLDKIVPNGIERIAASMRLLEADGDAMKKLATGWVEPIEGGFRIPTARLPLYDQTTWLYHAIRPFGFNRDQVMDIVQSKEVGSMIESNSHGLVKTREGYVIRLRNPGLEPLSISATGTKIHGSFLYTTTHLERIEGEMDNNSIVLSRAAVKLPLWIRSWRDGDTIRPFGKRQVNVSRYLTNQKVDRLAKQQTMVLTDRDDNILWLVGYAPCFDPDTSLAQGPFIRIERSRLD